MSMVACPVNYPDTGGNRPFLVDVMAATNRDLALWARQGRFREELYYRPSSMPLVLPPLPSQRRDIRLLAEHFLRLHAPYRLAPKFTPAALARLQQHSWPGNIRELRNVVRRALLVRQGPQLDESAIIFEQEFHRAPEDTGTPQLELPEGVPLERMMQRLERQFIESALRRCHFHKDRAAKELGLARSSLFKRLKLWGHSSEED